MLAGQRDRGPAAQAVADDVDLLETEVVEQPDHIAGQGGRSDHAVDVRGPSVALELDPDHPVPPDQGGEGGDHGFRPDALLAEAVLDAHDDPEAVARFAQRMQVEAAMAVVDVIRAGQLDRLRICAADDCDDVLADLSGREAARPSVDSSAGTGRELFAPLRGAVVEAA